MGGLGNVTGWVRRGKGGASSGLVVAFAFCFLATGRFAKPLACFVHDWENRVLSWKWSFPQLASPSFV